MISVCLPSFNGGQFISKQIESILPQLSIYDELLISDDGSIDNTIEIINAFNDRRIKYFVGPGEGVIKNVEYLLTLCSGDYIFLSDQDDIWFHKKIEICMSYLSNGYDFVVHNALIINENNKVLKDSFFDINSTSAGFIHNFIKNGYIGCCISFNQKLLKYVLPIPTSVGMHDIWIGNIASIFGKIAFINDRLISYRRHTNNFTVSIGKSNNDLITKINYRISLLSQLLKRFIVITFRSRKLTSN